jgi:hypothetical protein
VRNQAQILSLTVSGKASHWPDARAVAGGFYPERPGELDNLL